MEDSQSLYFYSPKIINIILLAVGLVFIVLGLLSAFAGFQEGILTLVVIGSFIALLFFALIIPTFKKFFKRKPYIIITKETLIINQPFRDTVPINLENINGFEMIIAQFNRLVYIKLKDDDKYRKQMSRRTNFLNKPSNAIGLSPIWIIWRQVKRKDRSRLVYELDRLSNSSSTIYKRLSTQLNNERREQQSNRKIDRKYLLKAYGYSFLITIAGFIGNEGDYTTLLIVSFILYPFAKIIFDVVLGFKIGFTIRKQWFTNNIYIIQLLVSLIYVLIYLLSVYIAPLGILYLLVKFFYGLFKKY